MTTTSESPVRKIIHIDMDCFYAAVEIRENPELAGKPVAVGGSADGRGVLTTCNYEARAFGLRSAMPTAQALKLCPKVILLPVRMALYKSVSAEIRQIFNRYTDQVEPLSLDEAYLDVSDCPHHNGSATLIATEIRKTIFNEQRLTASAGVAANKFLAKIASDWKKPNGQFVVHPDKATDFIQRLPIRKIPGVGPVTEQRLAKAGILQCKDMLTWSRPQLLQRFGQFGLSLHDYVRGIDDRPVSNHRERKSLSVETTFATDLRDQTDIIGCLDQLMEELQRRLDQLKTGPNGITGLSIKLKYHDFTLTTRQVRYEMPDRSIYEILLRRCLEERDAPVRLIGIGVSFGQISAQHQLALF